jgi:hypothetical protein
VTVFDRPLSRRHGTDHVTCGHADVDPQGVAAGYEDVFTKIEAARKYREECGLGAHYVKQFSLIRLGLTWKKAPI